MAVPQMGENGYQQVDWNAGRHRCGRDHVYGYPETNQSMDPEKMKSVISTRLDKFSDVLGIRSSQLMAWTGYADAVQELPEQHVMKPSEDADAATILDYQAENETDFARKLTRIADATATLQNALSNDQMKIFNQISRHMYFEKNGLTKKLTCRL